MITATAYFGFLKMKHTLKVTTALVLFFFAAQLVGLLIINQYIDHKKTEEKKEVVMKPLPYGFERPEVKNQSTSFIYIIFALLIGTALALLLIKFRKPFIFKFWFFITVWLTLSIAFAAFLNNIAAAVIAFILAVLKLYKPNIILHNISEIFIYGGLAAIFVPIINLFAAFMLLLLISVYDYISVFKTKHMIKLAKFQSHSKVFAGLFIPYKSGDALIKGKPKLQKLNEVNKYNDNVKNNNAEKIESKASKPSKAAVLGGGDIGFTLIFAGVVMKSLMLKETVLIGFLKTLIIPVFVTLALLILLIKGQQNKFYPAMPFLSLGCIVGYLVVWMVG